MGELENHRSVVRGYHTQRIRDIVVPGKYYFETHGETCDFRLPTRYEPQLAEWFKKTFPDLEVCMFEEADLHDDEDKVEFIPAELAPADIFWATLKDELYLGISELDLETSDLNTIIHYVSTQTNKESFSGRYTLEDIGKLSIVKNKLKVGKSKNNGKLHISYRGHGHEDRMYLEYDMEYEGEFPGLIISALVNHISNQLKKSDEAVYRLTKPLTKEESDKMRFARALTA